MDHHGEPLEGLGLEPADPLIWAGLDVVVVLLLLAAVCIHTAGLWAARRRSPWPRHRSLLFHLGLICAAGGLLGPVATAAHTSFTAHMLGHLLLGMIAPLLLVLSAPVTLALRALPVHAARGLTRALRSPGVRVLTHPVVAAVLNAGGLWLLYTTDLFRVMHVSPVAYALVHLHIFVAGYVFTASLIGVDPDPHRASMPVRAAVLILFIAAHSILAKWLYAHPPAGVEPGDGKTGAQLMYYGGDVVDISLLVLLFAGWYSATRPRHRAHDAVTSR
ncbi:cytochrome c oxidase assembly protein [Nesterenkonia sp. E16_7]|uniref:cytochrome c oxidase assembly protein n=1 Tax=unclassified Nesterenkonia TaxID=2629769 RepID=UPI001A9165F4|nr:MULTISPECIES: cytochrome c oxidase assembly protein [unclassified Nesterenkonia]MBO0595808.1 cytochrome c oxidase assembly protein [Nesterenkonia sp. E16_10]MBO0599593.1 cytochrome c oxidase assembly protein [Nesterenkonia sp. E16_7]